MCKSNWFRLLVIISLALNAEMDVQGQYYYSTRHVTRGADTAEIYINCWWYEDPNGIQWNGLFRSTDNGKTLTPMRKRKWFEESGVIHGDSISGRIFQVPMHMSPDTFGISFDYGLSFELNSFNPVFYSVAGCMAGEIYWQANEQGLGIYRSNDYGSSFSLQSSHDSIDLREVGTLPGEIYGIKWFFESGPLGLAYSNDYGQTFTVSYIEFPGFPEFSECMIYRGTEPGEIFFVIYYSDSEIYLFHTFDYGQTLTFQCQLPPSGGEMLYTAGRTPGTFYIVERYWAAYSVLYIYFSRDYGVTYTTYLHILDSTYTQTPTQSFPEKSFICYPNPASSFIQIDFQHPQSGYQVSLWDMLGNIRVSFVIPAGRKQIRLDLSNLPKGIYLLKVMNNKTCVGVKKVLVNK